MNKLFSYLTLILFLTIFSCDNNKQDEESAEEKSTNIEAKAASDYIIDNLEGKKVFDKFSNEHFDKFQIISLINDMKNNCDWNSRYGGYSKYYSSGDKAAFIYNYKLKCGALRFTLIFGLNYEEPQLMEFRIAPIKDAVTPNLDTTLAN